MSPRYQVSIQTYKTADISIENGEEPTEEPSTDVTDEAPADNKPQSNQSIENVQSSQTPESVLDNTNQPSDETVESMGGVEDGTDIPVNDDASNSENSSDTSISSDNTGSAD